MTVHLRRERIVRSMKDSSNHDALIILASIVKPIDEVLRMVETYFQFSIERNTMPATPCPYRFVSLPVSPNDHIHVSPENGNCRSHSL